MTPRRSATVLIVLVLSAVATAGCRHVKLCGSDTTGTDPAQEQPVDPALMAFLSRARAAHHDADLNDGNIEKSLRPLLALADGPIPVGSKGAQDVPVEVREVLADTHARIADLQSQQLAFDQAELRIATALKWMQNVSYFRGHLLETRGIVAERRAEFLVKSGRAEEAKQVRLSAIEAFEQAMEVQAAVIRAAGGKTSSPAPGSSTMSGP